MIFIWTKLFFSKMAKEPESKSDYSDLDHSVNDEDDKLRRELRKTAIEYLQRQVSNSKFQQMLTKLYAISTNFFYDLQLLQNIQLLKSLNIVQ